MEHMRYIRDRYGVPAKRGAKVCYSDLVGNRFGVITAARMGFIRIRFDGQKDSDGPFHPVWRIKYL